MSWLLAAAPVLPAPRPPEKVELVWASNPSAVIGAVICFLLLVAWVQQQEWGKDIEQEEEQHGDTDR